MSEIESEVAAPAPGPIENVRVPISMDDPTPWPNLNPVEDLWCRAYARTGSPREACASAGIPGNPKAVTRALLSRDEIRVALGVYMRMCAQAYSVQREAIIAQLARIGFADVADLYDEATDELLPPHRLPARIRGAITAVTEKVDRDGSVTRGYTLAPKVKSLELLSKILGMDNSKGSRPLRVRMVADPSSGRVTTEVELNQRRLT